MTYRTFTGTPCPGADKSAELLEVFYLSYFIGQAVPHLGSPIPERLLTVICGFNRRNFDTVYIPERVIVAFKLYKIMQLSR